MLDKNITYNEYLSGLNKTDLINILNEYFRVFEIHNIAKENNIEKKKKQEIITYLETKLDEYLKITIISLDRRDLKKLENYIRPSSKNINFKEENKQFISFLEEKKIIMKNKEEYFFLKDIKKKLQKYLKNKKVIKKNKNYNYIINRAKGLVVAYGVLEKEKFLDYFAEEDAILEKLAYDYKKEFNIENKRIVSTNLKNKKKVTKYLKNKNRKEFSSKELENLGNETYHQKMKSYRKLAKILKSNYVFKNSDLDFIDSEIIIPYLYKSVNEEALANDLLEKNIIKFFELNGEKLKEKMLMHIKKIREDFPLWEYGGYSKNEVNQ